MRKRLQAIRALRFNGLVMALSLNFCLFGVAAIVYGARLEGSANATQGTGLGEFALFNGGAAQGNAVTLPYGNAVEGGSLITYWQGGQVPIDVVPVTSNLYELVDGVGHRCLTENRTVVTLATCTGAASQLMALAAQGSGYTIQAGDGSCVEAPSSFSTLQARPCSGASIQNWTFMGPVPLSLPTTAPAAPSPAPTAPSPAPTAPAVPAAPVSGGTTLGSWSLLNEGATQGNSLTLMYGVSSEGNGLTTYWPAAQSGINVVAMGSNQYELVENTGFRCISVKGAAASLGTCTGSAGQLFTLTSQTDGSYTLQTGGSQCLEAPGAFTTVAAMPCGTALNERWLFHGATPLTLTGASAPVAAPPSSSTVPPGYQLTFDDEFGSLNISDQNGAGTKWYTHTVQCCLSDTSNPGTPTYMAGLTAPAGQNPYSLVPGGLDIRLQKTNGAWYSGVLASVDSNGQGFAQQYGYFEMKANFPAGLGTWPAFWLLNQAALTRHAAAGEIDVVESYMQFPTYVNTTLHDWTPPATTPGYKQASGADLSKGFHTFGMLWTASTMTFYLDGVTLYSFPTPPIMQQPYYPIIDLGLGGGWPTAKTPQQSDMIVQYVRVYAPPS